MYSNLTLFSRLAYIYFNMIDLRWLLRIYCLVPISMLATAFSVSSAVDLILLSTLMGIEDH